MRRAAPLLALLLLLAALPMQYNELDEFSRLQTSANVEVTDVPDWRVGDKWIYSGAFDAETLIKENGVSASVGEVTGDAEMVVQEILTMTVENESTLVYKTLMSADFDKNGVELDGYSGNLFIDFAFTEYHRVSDLASIKSDLSLGVEFRALGFINIDVADITISNDYSPPNEIMDFPMRLGERWMNNYTQDTSWSGNSDYITPFPADESGIEQSNYGITSIGAPVNQLGQTISYGGCGDSFEITGWNDAGEKESYRWYCPDIRSLAWIHTDDDVGLTMDFRIKSYHPIGSSGVDVNSNPGTRDNGLDVELEFPLFSPETDLSVWANSSNPNDIGKSVEFRHERTGMIQSATISSNGSAHLVFDSGSARDGSYTSTDHSSHGIIAWLDTEQVIGTTTLTLDENVVALDLLAVPERAYIERNRSGIVSELNELSGWNVIPGDILRMELPIMNRGITESSPASVQLLEPDGSEKYLAIPALKSQEQTTVEMYWTVPNSTTIGNISISWTVIPGQDNSNDADTSNDMGQILLFIGRLPSVVIRNHSAVMTQEVLQIDASESFDPDGGKVWCSFYIEYDDGVALRNLWTTVWTSDCILNWTWLDDGVYEVLVNVVDEERDSMQFLDSAEIINRPPEVRIIASRNNASSFGTISLLAVGNDSDSEDSWPGMVDMHWPDAQCEEGWYTHQCTVTWDEEGLRRYTAVATDDDGATTETTIDLFYSNIAPFELDIEMWDGQTMIETDQQGVWHIAEDAVVNLVSSADDSINDRDELEHSWQLAHTGSYLFAGSGTSASIPHSWSNSGEHEITLMVTDDNSEMSEKSALVMVHNIPPMIEEISDPLPIAEGQSVSLDAKVDDTPSDRETLRVCWDIDPGINSDEIGDADDDCNVMGPEFEYSWIREGTYPVVLNVVDDDGARSSQIINISVMNRAPKVKVTLPEVIYSKQLIELDASKTTDSENDMPTLDYLWDLDARVDSNGDGDPENDVDEIGMVIKKRWNLAGEYQIVLRVADEDKKNPGIKQLTIIVVDDESSLLNTVSSQVVGPDASIIVQLLLGLLGLLLLAFVIGRFRPKSEQENWMDDDEVALSAGMDPKLLSEEPMHSPPEYAFQNSAQITQSTEVVAKPSTSIVNTPKEVDNVPSMAGLLDELDI